MKVVGEDAFHVNVYNKGWRILLYVFGGGFIVWVPAGGLI